MFGLNFLTPKPLIKLMRNKLEEQFKKPIPFFSVIYIEDKQSLNIVVDGIFYPYIDNNVITLVKSTAKKHLKNNQKLDVISAQVDDKNNVEISLCYSEQTKEGIKKSKNTFKL
jgi:hypothetical protein